MTAQNLPPDIMTEIQKLRDRIQRLENAPRATNTSIDEGGLIIKDPNTGNIRLYIGALPTGDTGVIIYRDDGTVALRVGKSFSTDSFQTLQLFNRSSGRAIVGDSFLNLAGFGGFPSAVQLIPNQLDVANTSLEVSTTQAAFTVPQLTARTKYVQGQLWGTVIAYASDGTTSGEILLYDEVGNAPYTGFFGATQNPVVVPIGTTVPTEFPLFPGNGNMYMPGDIGDDCVIGLRARRTAGAGTIKVRPGRLSQVG